METKVLSLILLGLFAAVSAGPAPDVNELYGTPPLGRGYLPPRPQCDPTTVVKTSTDYRVEYSTTTQVIPTTYTSYVTSIIERPVTTYVTDISTTTRIVPTTSTEYRTQTQTTTQIVPSLSVSTVLVPTTQTREVTRTEVKTDYRTQYSTIISTQVVPTISVSTVLVPTTQTREITRTEVKTDYKTQYNTVISTQVVPTTYTQIVSSVSTDYRVQTETKTSTVVVPTTTTQTREVPVPTYITNDVVRTVTQPIYNTITSTRVLPGDVTTVTATGYCPTQPAPSCAPCTQTPTPGGYQYNQPQNPLRYPSNIPDYDAFQAQSSNQSPNVVQLEGSEHEPVDSAWSNWLPAINAFRGRA